MQTVCMNNSILNHKFQMLILSITRERTAEVDMTNDYYISTSFVSRPRPFGKIIGSEHETLSIYSISVCIVTIN